MANSILTYAGTPGFGPYTATFTLGKLRDEYVQVRVNEEVDGLDAPLYRDIEWISDTLFNITSGTEPDAGDEVHVIRTIPVDELIHDYENGAVINEENLDESNLQTIMLIHQFLDGRITSALQNDLDLGDNKIINLADGTDPTDAVNLSQLQPVLDVLEDAETAAADAETAKVAAELAETNAETAEANAEAALVLAQAAAAAAASSAAEGLYNSVLDITTTPYVPLLADEGAMYRVDTSAGNVVVNLDALSTYAEDMKFAFVKTTADANTITINRGGTDTINDTTSITIDTQFVVTAIIGDLSSGTWTRVLHNASIADGTVTNAKMANMAQATFKMRAAGAGTGAPIDGTASQLRSSAGLVIGLDVQGYDADTTKNDVANTFTALQTFNAGIAPDAINFNGSAASGLLVQRAIATYTANSDLTTDLPRDDTIPQVGEGTEIISQAFTAKKTGNKILLRFQGMGSVEAAGNISAALFIDGGPNAVAATSSYHNIANAQVAVTFEYEYTAPDTSSHTFSVRAGPEVSGSNTKVRFNGNTAGRYFGGVAATTLVIEEYAT